MLLGIYIIFTCLHYSFVCFVDHLQYACHEGTSLEQTKKCTPVVQALRRLIQQTGSPTHIGVGGGGSGAGGGGDKDGERR